MGFVYIHVNDPGLPIWQVLPLTLLGCALGLGLVWCMVALIDKASWGTADSPSGPGGEGGRGRLTPLRCAGRRGGRENDSFMEVHSAWDAGDRQRLGTGVSDLEVDGRLGQASRRLRG